METDFVIIKFPDTYREIASKIQDEKFGQIVAYFLE